MKNSLLVLMLLLFISCGGSDNKTDETEVQVTENDEIVSSSAGIFESAKNGNLVDVKQYIENGVTINARDEEGNTALIIAQKKWTYRNS